MTKNDKSNEIEKIVTAAKTNLKKLMDETSRLAKRGEKELVNLSKLGKLEFDILNLHLRRENLCREVGEKIVEMSFDKKLDDQKIKNLSSEIRDINSKITEIKAEVDKLTKVILQK